MKQHISIYRSEKVEIRIAKYLISFLDDNFIEIIEDKKSKMIWAGNISDIEITFYHPQKTITRVPGMIITLPNRTMALNLVNRNDSGEIKRLYEQLVYKGAVVNLHNAFVAGGVKHFSIRAENEYKKEELREKRISDREKRKEEKLKKRQKRGEEALENLEKSRKRAGCKVFEEEKYTCTVCRTTWHLNEMDKIKNLHNALVFTNYSVNQMQDMGRCPQCGSKAVTHKTVKYWLDKEGNCVDREE